MIDNVSIFRKKSSLSLLILFIFNLWSVAAYSYETAPKISDREIVESLTELKAGHQSLNKRLDDMNQSINKRFEAVDKRFEAVDKRFDDMNQSINKRFDAVDKRFDDMNQNINKRFEAIDKRFESIDKRFESIDKRFDELEQKFNARFSELQNLILTLYGAVMALIIALIGYMIWDRKTAQEPLKVRLGKVETDVVVIEDQLEIKNPSGSVVIRLIATLRKLAETDERVAAILRSYSLM